MKIKSISKYFQSSLGLIDRLRIIMLEIRFSMKDVIQTEIASIDREYAFGIFVLAILPSDCSLDQKCCQSFTGLLIKCNT